MKKLALAILIIAVAMPAFASETRVRALGPMTAPYIEDDSGVFMWPATLAGYANLVTITAGYYNVVKWQADAYYTDDMTARFGLTYGLGEENKYGVFGIWFQEYSWGPNYDGMWAGPFGYTEFREDVFNKWNVMWALGMDAIDIGVRFERADEMYKGEGDGVTYEDYLSYTTLGLGLRWDLNDETFMDFAFDYTTVGYTHQDGGDEIIENDANSIMTLRGRMFYEWTDVITWVPYFSYKTGDLSLQSNQEGFYGTDECWGIKGFQFDLGLAANINVNDDNLLIVGIEPYGYYKGEPSECGSDADTGESKMTVFPGFILGLESDIKDWLTFRAGCDKALLKTTYEWNEGDVAYEENYTWAPFNWYLGLGFHVSDFDIDLLLNKETPFSMGYWLTGYQPPVGSGAPIGMISATYAF